MPRYKEPFTIFPRKLSNGKYIYYYRTYSPDGKRTSAKSTGQTNKTQARNYCTRLLAEGHLYSGTGMTFEVYAQNFFGTRSQWYADKLQTSAGKEQAVAKNTLKAYRHNNEAFLIPFFGKYKLADINTGHIRKFREYMLEKGFSGSAINLSCATLKIIFSYAKSENLMQINPFGSLKQVYTDAKVKKSFDISILTETFKNWKSSRDSFCFALIAATTGMRISEIMAIRKETLFSDYLDIHDQLLDKELCPVKDGEKRKIRLSYRLQKIIESCVKRNNGTAFIQEQDTYRTAFYKNLPFSNEQRKKEELTFHSLRHFFNTYLLANDIPEIKVKSMLGHSSGKGSMTERYANFSPKDFNDIAELQNKLLSIFL